MPSTSDPGPIKQLGGSSAMPSYDGELEDPTGKDAPVNPEAGDIGWSSMPRPQALEHGGSPFKDLSDRKGSR